MDRFNICQAHAQLESDYNVDGWLRERPSNKRRMEATSIQLNRMGFSNPYGWVEICAEYDPEHDDPNDEEVREVYLRNVLAWGLPIDAEMMACMRRFFAPKFLAKYPQTSGEDYLQGR